MSHYVSPFLVLNLGAEMVFVVAQRLQAQNISMERTNLVLDEIISTLISKQLITEIMKPQATYSQESVRDLIEDVTQSSMMRLDTISMGKLWDLITMVFKWQLSQGTAVIPITLRHLYEIEHYITNPETQLQLHKVEHLIDNFEKILTTSDKEELRRSILYWLKESNVRVSLLLRMGLQRLDGEFETENLNPVAEEMLRNLGENIYAVTQNGKILENYNNKNNNEWSNQPEVNELQLFVDQILGDRKLSTGAEVLKLSIAEPGDRDEVDNKKFYKNDKIDVQTGNINKMILDDFTHTQVEENVNNNSLKDDLLAMIGESQ